MNKVALITYHAAYNFGSALQALATQNVIRDISGDCTIINYRMLSQKKFYSNIRTGLGFKTFLKDFLRLPAWKQLNIRATRFENFQENYFNLSSCFTTPEEIYRYWNEFDTIVSGSDQIWNKHSCELENVSFNYMFPYLLKDYCGKKISYASSIGNMTDADLETIHLYIDEFSSISMRESSSAARLSKLLNREIPTVLDPTLLLSGNEWKETLKINDYSNEPYILYYSLSYYKEINKWIPALERLAKNHNMKVKIITPFVYLKLNKDIFERHYDYGPVEFVDANYQVLSQFARGQNKMGIFALSGVINSLVLFASDILFLVMLRYGLNGWMIAYIIGKVVACLYVMRAVKINTCFSIKSISKDFYKEAAKYALPLLPTTSLWWVMNASDRYIIALYMGTAANGIYAVANKMPSILSVFENIFYQAWQTSSINALEDKNRDRFYSRVSHG